MTAVLPAAREAGRRRARRRLRGHVAQGRFAAPADPRRAQQDRRCSRRRSCAPRRRCARRDARRRAARRAGAARVARRSRHRPAAGAARARPARRRAARRARAAAPAAARATSIGSAASRSGMFAEDVSFSYAPLLAEIVALGATHVALVVPLYQTDATSHDIGLHTRLSPTLAALAEVVARRQARRAAGDAVPDHPPVVAARRANGAARWPRAIATPGSSATATCWASWARSRASPAPRAWSSAASCRRWRTTSTTGGRWSSACAPSSRASSSIRPTGITTARPRSSTWSTRRGSRATSTCARRPAPPTTRRWRRAGGASRREIEAWRVGRTRPLHLHRARLPLAQGRHRRAVGRGPGGTPDLDEQRRAFAAFRRVWATAAALDGVYIWNWYGYGGLGTTSYTPRGKPAEIEVRALLGAHVKLVASSAARLRRAATRIRRDSSTWSLPCPPRSSSRPRRTPPPAR